VFVLSEAICRVVQKARALELKLQRTEERLSQIAENIQEAVWLADRQHYLYFSPAHAVIWGHGKSDSRFPTREEFLATVVEEDRPSVAHFFQAQFQTAQEIEYRIQRADGSIRLIRDRAFPVNTEPSEGERVAGVAEDITHERAMEEELQHAQKMEVLGRMAGCVAHDFNNILSVIQSYSFLLRSELRPGAFGSEAISEIDLAVDRANNLTKRLLAFTRKQKPVRKVADLNEIVKGMMLMFMRLLDSNIKLHFQPSAAPLAINVDRGLLEHAILNLLINARDAMPDGGSITLGTFILEPDDKVSSGDLSVTRACLSVADTGIGMSEEVLPKIFEPFFTTKPLGKGTGLGLSAVDRIVKENDGTLQVVSNAGRGTTFTLSFPVVAQRPEARQIIQPEIGLEAPDERILLLVEEEPHNRAATKRILSSSGYNVLDCRSALRAIELCESLKNQIGLVITDMSLPDGFSGMELAEQLRKKTPALPVLFTNGNLSQLVLEDRITKTVAKPCKPETLLQTVKELIGNPAKQTAPPQPASIDSMGGASASHDLAWHRN
jgi:PAS domain S-box-containing protein